MEVAAGPIIGVMSISSMRGSVFMAYLTFSLAMTGLANKDHLSERRLVCTA